MNRSHFFTRLLSVFLFLACPQLYGSDDVELVYGTGTSEKVSVSIPLDVFQEEMPGSWDNFVLINEFDHGKDTENEKDVEHVYFIERYLEKPGDVLMIIANVAKHLATLRRKPPREMKNSNEYGSGGNDSNGEIDRDLVGDLRNHFKTFNAIVFNATSKKILNCMYLAEYLGMRDEVIRCLAKEYLPLVHAQLCVGDAKDAGKEKSLFEAIAYHNLPFQSKEEVAREELLWRFTEFSKDNKFNIESFNKITDGAKKECGLKGFNPSFSIAEFLEANAFNLEDMGSNEGKQTQTYNIFFEDLELFNSLDGIVELLNLFPNDNPSCRRFFNLLLKNNKLKTATIPEELGKVLIFLRLNDNQLKSVTLPLSMDHLYELDLSGNKLTKINLKTACQSLGKLDLSNNRLSSFDLPPGLANVTHLDLRGNNLCRVTLYSPSSLQRLQVSNNELAEIDLPDDMPNLKMLELRGNRLTEIELPDLPELDCLDLSGNNLAYLTLPKDMAKLKYLWLGNNELVKLTLPATSSETVERIDVKHNRLKTFDLPNSVPKLHRLFLVGNPVELQKNLITALKKDWGELLLIIDDDQELVETANSKKFVRATQHQKFDLPEDKASWFDFVYTYLSIVQRVAPRIFITPEDIRKYVDELDIRTEKILPCPPLESASSSSAHSSGRSTPEKPSSPRLKSLNDNN